MNKTKTIQFRAHIDGDPMSVGVSFVDVSSFTVPVGMELDARAGQIRWTAPENERDLERREITFDYFVPAEVSVSADKAQIAADGVEQVTLTIECEDTQETSVPIAVYEDGDKIGSFDVAVSNGSGQAQRTIAVTGSYTYRVDPDVLDATWNVSEFRDVGDATVEAV